MCQDYDQFDLARFQSLTVDEIKDSVSINIFLLINSISHIDNTHINYIDI